MRFLISRPASAADINQAVLVRLTAARPRREVPFPLGPTFTRVSAASFRTRRQFFSREFVISKGGSSDMRFSLRKQLCRQSGTGSIGSKKSNGRHT